MANLLKWGKGVVAQINPFDGGKTYDTVQRDVQPTPAPTQYVPQAVPFRPTAQLEQQQPKRTIFSKVYDQVNPFDNGLSYSNGIAREQRSVIDQAARTAGDLTVKPIIAAGAGIGANLTSVIEKARGNDVSARDVLNQTTKDNGFGQYLTDDGATDLTTGRQIIGNTIMGAANVVPGSGRIGSEALVKVAPRLAETVAPQIFGTAVTGGATGAVSNVGATVASEEPLTPNNLLKSAAQGAAFGAVAGAGGEIAARGVQKGAQKAIDSAQEPAIAAAEREAGLKRSQVVNDTEANTLRDYTEAITGDKVGDSKLTYQRAMAIAKNIGLDITSGSATERVDRVYNYLKQRSNFVQSRDSVLQGGYVRLPGGARDPAADLNVPQKEFINDYANMIEEIDASAKGGQMQATADGGYIRTTEHSPFYRQIFEEKGRAPTKEEWFNEARRQIESGKAAYGASDDYKTIGIPEAEVVQPAAAIEQPTPVETPPVQSPVEIPTPAVENVPPVSSTSSKVKLNTKRLDVTDEAAARLDKETTEVIDKLTFKDVQEAAKAAGIDTKSYTEAETRKKIAEQLNQRRQASEFEANIAKARAEGASTEEIADLMRQSAEAGRTSRTQGTDIARQLAARRILADELNTPMQRIFKILDEAGVSPEVYTKRLADVDFDNAADVVKAYREMVPAKFEDWLDKYRYTNMLSSPLTHIVNIFSNAQGVGLINPARKAVEGGIDAIKSAITGSERTRFAGEGASYLKGALQSLPEAAQQFKDIFTGKVSSELPDAQTIKQGKLAYDGVAGIADTVFSFVPKLLEATDQFGLTLGKGGERASLAKRAAKGVEATGDVEGKIQDAADYTLFRQQLGKEGQGTVLDSLDWIPKQLLAARNAKNPVVRNLSKFTLPFVTTPTNVFKQGIEYSPLGITTVAGSADKTAQLAKAAIGSSVIGLTAGTLGATDRLTFSEPSDAKQRDAFRAEGKQAYAIKVGDKWINYSKLHPAIAFNLATVAAVKDATDKGAIDESQGDKILRAASGVMGFFRDQSYMKSVGDFTSNLQMKDGAQIEDAFASMAGNYANQLSPFKSMVSWIGRQIDPTQRKTNYDAGTATQIYQTIVKDIPGLNKDIPVRQDPYTGGAVMNDNPLFNAVSPLRVTNDKGFGNTTGLNPEQRMAQQSLPADQRELFRQDIINQKASDKETADAQALIKRQDERSVYGGAAKTTATESKGDIKQLPNGKYYAKVGKDFKTFNDEKSATEAVAKEAFTKSGEKSKTIGDTFYYKDAKGEIKSKPKVQYDYDQIDSRTSLAMDRAKSADDVDAWLSSAAEKYAALETLKSQYDPDTQADKINDIIKKQEDLQEKADKYDEQGGFTKGSTAKKKGIFKAPTGGGFDLVGAATGTQKLLAISQAKITPRKVS